MDLEAWLDARGGIAHRQDVIRNGFTKHAIGLARAAGGVRTARRYWLYTRACPDQTLHAATLGGRLTCLTAARLIGLWTIDDGRMHLRVPANSKTRVSDGLCLHWGSGLTPVSPYVLVEPVENVIAHIVACQPFESAVVVIDSLLNSRVMSLERLVRLSIPGRAFQLVKDAVGVHSDSGIESLPAVRLRRAGITLRQQAMVDGHRVDGLIGERLVIQIDGGEHHMDPAQRDRDIRQDARLVLMGYTVLRFNYRQVMFEWDYVEATIRAAMAQGAHRASRRAS